MRLLKDEKLKRKLTWVLFIAIFLIGVILIFLPKDYFDEGQSVCLSVVFFDLKCYGCGMTRAIQHLIHLDFKEAFEYNKLSIIVFPLLVFMISKEFYAFVRNKKND
jgi:drug/metabolite transporter (DMT)-like permease